MPMPFRIPSLARAMFAYTMVAALVVGCSSGGSDGGAPITSTPTPGTLAVAVSPSALSLVAGGTTSSPAVTIARGGSFTGPVTLSVTGLPSNVTATLGSTTLDAPTTSTTLVLGATAGATAGSYAITVTASGTSVTTATTSLTVDVTAAASPAFAFTLAGSTLSVASGTNGSIPIAITRSGSFTGPVSFAVSGAPAGVTATVAPASAPNDTARLSIVVPAGTAATAAPITLTVRGSGSGVTDVTRTLALTITAPPVTGAFSLAVSPATLTVRQGQTTTATVTVTRTGGFTGAVDLAVSGLPSGVTAALVPNTTGATLQLTAAATAAPASFTLTVTGTAAGLATQTAAVSATISTSSSAAVIDEYCRGDSDNPIFYAMQDGTTGAWTRVLPESTMTSVLYRFSPTQPRFGIASVLSGSDAFGAPNYTLKVMYTTPEELAAGVDPIRCGSTYPRTLSGTVAGLDGKTAFIQAGFLGVGRQSTDVTSLRPSFTISGLPDEPVSVLASRIDTTGDRAVVDRMIVRRGVPGNALGTLDFNGTEAFAPASARVTVRGTSGADTAIFGVRYAIDGAETSWIAQNNIAQISTIAFALYDGRPPATATSGPLPYYGIPAERLHPDERQVLEALLSIRTTLGTANGVLIRSASQVFQTVTDRTLTFGPVLSAPRFTETTTSPYRRPTITLPRQAEYGFFADVGTFAGANFLELQMTTGYSGSGDWTMPTPDLSAVPGWRPEYAPQAGPLAPSGVVALGIDPAASTYLWGTFLPLPAGLLRDGKNALQLSTTRHSLFRVPR